MKRLSIILLLILFSIQIYAQRTKTRKHYNVAQWYSFAFKGGFGTSYLINKNIGEDVNVVSEFFTPSYSAGARIGVSFGDNFGIFFESLYYSFGQSYELSKFRPKKFVYNKRVELTSIDYALLLRYAGGSGRYFEIGLKKSSLLTAKITNSIENPNFYPTDSILNAFYKNYNNMFVGVGLALSRKPRTEFNVGLRFNFALSNIISNENLIMDDGLYQPIYKEHKSMKPVTIHLMAEYNYYFGFYTQATCGKSGAKFFE